MKGHRPAGTAWAPSPLGSPHCVRSSVSCVSEDPSMTQTGSGSDTFLSGAFHSLVHCSLRLSSPPPCCQQVLPPLARAWTLASLPLALQAALHTGAREPQTNPATMPSSGSLDSLRTLFLLPCRPGLLPFHRLSWPLALEQRPHLQGSLLPDDVLPADMIFPSVSMCLDCPCHSVLSLNASSLERPSLTTFLENPGLS